MLSANLGESFHLTDESMIGLFMTASAAVQVRTLHVGETESKTKHYTSRMELLRSVWGGCHQSSSAAPDGHIKIQMDPTLPEIETKSKTKPCTLRM